MQYLAFLWKLRSLLSKHCSVLPMGSCSCLLPGLTFCLLCLGMKHGHPGRRTAFRAVCLSMRTLPTSALLLDGLWEGF